MAFKHFGQIAVRFIELRFQFFTDVPCQHRRRTGAGNGDLQRPPVDHGRDLVARKLRVIDDIDE